MSTLDWAIWYTRRGWRVVPTPHQSKNPGRDGWQNLRLDEAQLPLHFNREPMNIGVLLGEPSGNLIDVDLDHPLAVELADQFLPPTPCEFGRPGKLRSHRLYVVKGHLETRRFRLGEHGMIVERRSTGAQTVFPPSTHDETGELIDWVDPSAVPAEVDADALVEAVDRLFEAVRGRLDPKSAQKRKPAGRSPAKPSIKFTADDACDESPAGVLDSRVQDCLAAMKRMRVQDQNDGSHRLFVAACRAVEHNLDDTQAVACIRTYAQHKPFKRAWTDEEIIQRIRDAEKKCDRGAANDDDAGDSTERRSQASIVLDLCEGLDLFHFDDTAYVTLTLGERIDTLSLRERRFKRWVARRFHQSKGRAPNSQALTDAIGVLEGRALFEGPERTVHVRLAEHEGGIFLDLGDSAGRIVRIRAGAWEIVTDAPVRFRRPRGLLPLPVPIRGGSVDELREYINLAGEEAFILLVAWLIGALRPGWPVPVLAFSSEQGSGKSTACRMLRSLIDPNRSPIRAEPREVRDLMIAANNGLVVAYDNLSRVPEWLSDALCRLSTGGGFSTRVLYENDEEMIFDALRPVMLNGIEELGSRSDLLDRTIRLSLPAIPKEHRRPEQELYTAFDGARPRILGGLIEAVAAALSNLGAVRFDRLPRMADFARWVVAAESALPWAPGAFMHAYQDNRAGAHELALESSPVSEPLRRFAEEQGSWTGRVSELLQALNMRVEDQVRRQQGWPKRPNTFSGLLRRLAPNFRAVGIEIDFHDRTREGRLVTVRKVLQEIVTTVTDRHIGPADGAALGGGDDPAGPGDDGVTIPDCAQVPAVTQRDDGDDRLGGLSDDLLADLQERAAIMEFDGGLSREDAESLSGLAVLHRLNGYFQAGRPRVPS